MFFFYPKLVPKKNSILEQKPGVLCGGPLPLKGGRTDPLGCPHDLEQVSSVVLHGHTEK